MNETLQQHLDAEVVWKTRPCPDSESYYGTGPHPKDCYNGCRGTGEVLAHPECDDCKRPYGDEYGFPDLVIPDDVWQRISSTSSEGGLLCPSCICKRLHDAQINCSSRFTSGPLAKPTRAKVMPLLNMQSRVEAMCYLVGSVLFVVGTVLIITFWR